MRSCPSTCTKAVFSGSRILFRKMMIRGQLRIGASYQQLFQPFAQLNLRAPCRYISYLFGPYFFRYLVDVLLRSDPSQPQIIKSFLGYGVWKKRHSPKGIHIIGSKCSTGAVVPVLWLPVLNLTPILILVKLVMVAFLGFRLSSVDSAFDHQLRI